MAAGKDPAACLPGSAAAGACPSAIYRGLNEEEEQVQGLAGLTRAQREKNPCSPSRF